MTHLAIRFDGIGLVQRSLDPVSHILKMFVVSEKTMPLVKRKSCRAVILNPDNEILLIKIENPEGSWEGWITPGGGIEDGEDEISALQRELYEELGVNDLTIGAKIWVRSHVFPWKGDTVEQHEVFYLVRTNHFAPKPSLNPDLPEFSDLKEFRWWGLEKLLNTQESLAPGKLSAYLQELIVIGIPSSPVDVGI